MRYSDIPRHCNLQIRHVHVIYGSDVHTSPTAKQNEGLLNQDHKFWNKSFARSRVPFRSFPYLPRDEEKMLAEENVMPGTTLTVVAAAWPVTGAM